MEVDEDRNEEERREAEDETNIRLPAAPSLYLPSQLEDEKVGPSFQKTYWACIRPEYTSCICAITSFSPSDLQKGAYGRTKRRAAPNIPFRCLDVQYWNPTLCYSQVYLISGA